MSLGQRKRRILKAVIDAYIENAEPIGSKSVAERFGRDISSATIRSEMSDLEQLGYLEQPHISAGRVPSQSGYRFYVNELMNRYNLSVRELEALNDALRLRMRELDRLIRDAGAVVGELTNYTAFAAMPTASRPTIRKYTFLYIDAHTVIIVIVTASSVVKNKYYKSREAVREEELSRLARLFNERFTGITLDNITLAVIKKVEREAGGLSEFVAEVFDFVAEVIAKTTESDVYVDGVSRMLGYPEYRDPERARQILDYLSDFHGIAPLSCVDPTPDEGELEIKIGGENPIAPLKETSIIYGTYCLNSQHKGVIGIIGPTRMDYAKVAANLNYFIRGFNKLIKRTFSDTPESDDRED